MCIKIVVFQVRYFNFDGNEWMKLLTNTSIRIGSPTDDRFKDSFTGSISCLQVYNLALNEAEIPQKKSCNDAKDAQTNVCPSEYTLINDVCFKVVF